MGCPLKQHRVSRDGCRPPPQPSSAAPHPNHHQPPHTPLIMSTNIKTHPCTCTTSGQQQHQPKSLIGNPHSLAQSQRFVVVWELWSLITVPPDLPISIPLALPRALNRLTPSQFRSAVSFSLTWRAILAAMSGVGSSNGSARRVQSYPHAVIANALCRPNRCD
jgi:hypothetical protein